MLYGLRMNLEANAILVYSALTDMRFAVRFTAGIIAPLSIRSLGKHILLGPTEQQQNTQLNEAGIDFPY